MGLQYNQYTTCVKASDHLDWNQYLRIFLEAFAASAIGAAIVAASGEPWCLLFVLPITIIQGTLAYCHWWLEDRLICLGGDQSIVGLLVRIEPPEEKSGLDAWDTDYSINLLPATNTLGAARPVVEKSAPYGFLIAENDQTKAAGLVWNPGLEHEKASNTDNACMHAEFEGAGVRDVLLGSQIGLFFAVAALIACMAIPFPWGIIVAAILAFLALLAWLIGLFVGHSDKGSPTDVNPALANLHTNVNDATGVGKGADILFVVGLWVYDSGHNNQGRGWNELHPIKYCTSIAKWDGSWPTNINDLTKDADDQYGKTSSSLTIANQQEPQNQWNIHPLIDGCEPANNEPPRIG